VGSKIHSSWALTTSQGIILIDTLFTYNSDEEIVGGLRKLGFDPAKVKYVIISHAHSDHDGGAKLMQDEYGSRIIMGGPDWDSIEKSGILENALPNTPCADEKTAVYKIRRILSAVFRGHFRGFLSKSFHVTLPGR